MEVQSTRCDDMEEYSWKQVCREGNDQKVIVRHDAEKQHQLAIMGTSSDGADRNHTCKGIFVSQANSAFLVIYC